MSVFKRKDKQNELLIEQLTRIADGLASSPANPMPKPNETDVKKAAYALNMCLVSVSQIVDYSDLYILEQEYNDILNNLNLENMPKDAALLDILRQLLDTITYFRIQEVEKSFIEQAYQQSIKNAIWSAMPNCSIIMTSGDPTAILTSLITQVGVGYMNYRQVKAELTAKNQRDQWELERSAIEQFNGLRRELFTTAWRLAEKYKFDDAWRLSERQIERYNKILMESNLRSRLESLTYIEDEFEAYPPFWYFKGHTALTLLKSAEDFEKAELVAIAKDAYKKYFSINDEGFKLLRCDPFYSSCALEYACLAEEDEKRPWIDKACANAREQNDVLQLCAVAYLDIGEFEKASDILRKFVREDYNAVFNAQLLSTLYIDRYLASPSVKIKFQYDTLCSLVDRSLLLDWPEDAACTTREQYDAFWLKRRENAISNYAGFLVKYYSTKRRAFQAQVLECVSERERALVEFLRSLCEELSVILDDSRFEDHIVARIKEHDGLLRAWIKKEKKQLPFDALFEAVFVDAAERFSATDLSVPARIAAFEKKLSDIYGRYVVAVPVGEGDTEEYTLNSLYHIADTDGADERFDKIKRIVKASKLLKADAKYTELLVAGEENYNRYIDDHKLDGDEVIAVINDRTLTDSDLIFTPDGLLVQIAGSKYGRLACYMASGLAAMCAIASESLNTPVPYSQIQFIHTKDKLDKPYYKNKNVDMEELRRLIEQIRDIYPEDSVESRLYNTVLACL